MSAPGFNPNEYPMVNIPAGEIQLRDDRIKSSWTVKVDAFQLASVPVTKALYYSLMPQSTGFAKVMQAPVVDVSWNDAIEFCNVLSRHSGLDECYSVTDDGKCVICNWEADGYRLPTEAEWQYACRAGSDGYRYGELDDIAWYEGNSGGALHEVGKKRPNAWEWCWDVYDPDVYGSYRVFRGGSWAEEARGCGATCRRRSHPTFRIEDLGFRLARSISR
ncbi:formylglycine-generating enzyme family protein [Paenibacillus lautus]|uniref:formylglycine-generating enzyme family protein n=1 Tax=Paenibacillus lautus TaxID=1401 RepID=UPI003F59173A